MVINQSDMFLHFAVIYCNDDVGNFRDPHVNFTVDNYVALLFLTSCSGRNNSDK